MRHGENPANIQKVFSSRKIDPPLTEKGVLQAEQTAVYFANLKLDEEIWINRSVYSSPLRRASQTAEIIARALGLEVRILEAFREIEVGTLEDQPVSAAAWSFHREVMNDWFVGRSGTRFTIGLPIQN